MRLILSLIILVFALTACGGNPPPEVGTAGELVEWENRCSEALDGQRLAIEGYFSLGDSFSAGRNGTAVLVFRPIPRNDSITVLVSVGTGAGQVKAPPNSYELEDLEFRSSTGEVLGHEDAIRLSYTVKYNGLNPLGEPTCTYEAPFLIESLAGASSETATEESE